MIIILNRFERYGENVIIRNIGKIYKNNENYDFNESLQGMENQSPKF